MTRIVVIVLTLLWASPSWAGWVEDLHSIWDMVVNGVPNSGGGMVPTLKHSNCHLHNDDCRSDPWNPHCWVEDSWPQRCEQGGKAGFVCDLEPEHPFCTSCPIVGCSRMPDHPMCPECDESLPPAPQGLVARWHVGHSAIQTRMTEGACAVRKHPHPSGAAYNTACALPVGIADGGVVVGQDISPTVLTKVCGWKTNNFSETEPSGGIDGITYALRVNGQVVPSSVVNTTGSNEECITVNIPLAAGDVLQAGRDLEPFGCSITCATGQGTCTDFGVCAGNALGTAIAVFN